MARETLEQKVPIDKNGAPRRLSVRRVAFQRIGEKASDGDIKSMNFLLAQEDEEKQHLAFGDHYISAETALDIIRLYLERQNAANGEEK